ncbi:MAG TPA: hypothetical protein VGC14_05845 [Rhizobium sp.]
MFQNFEESEAYVRYAGLRASIEAALAADPVCCEADLSVCFFSYAIVIEGLANPEAALRAREIVADIAKPSLVLDRIIWVRNG